jgi:hypothetical protein
VLQVITYLKTSIFSVLEYFELLWKLKLRFLRVPLTSLYLVSFIHLSSFLYWSLVTNNMGNFDSLNWSIFIGKICVETTEKKWSAWN